jgi:hypothetical protein
MRKIDRTTRGWSLAVPRRECYPVKPLLWIGILLVALGLLSFVVPIPHTEHEGISVGGVSMGVTTQHSQTVSPIISMVMILGGVGMVIVGKAGK